MNKKGEADFGELLLDNSFYILALVAFAALFSAFIYQQFNGASMWEEHYAIEIVKAVDYGRAGDEVRIDVHKASEIAKRNNVDFKESITFNNNEKKLCVKLSESGGTCYNYFNNVLIVNSKIVFGVPVNVLEFEIKEGKA